MCVKLYGANICKLKTTASFTEKEPIELHTVQLQAVVIIEPSCIIQNNKIYTRHTVVLA